MNASAGADLDSAKALTALRLTRTKSRLPSTDWVGLVWTLVRTDFKVRYHGTIGGFIWALAKPLAMFALLMWVFSFIFGTDPDYRLNLIIGLFLWDFFADSTKAGLTSLHTRGYLLGKARCPSWILVVTSISNALITLIVFSVVIMLFLIGANRPPTLWAFALYLSYCSMFILIVIGFSLGSSVLFLRHRDLNQVWEVVAQAGFFFAPIIYPLGILPERLHLFLYIWPPTPVIEFSRQALVQGVTPTATAHLLLAMVAAVSLASGIALFRRFGPRAAEYV